MPKVIVTRQNSKGTYDQVGMSNRTIVSDLKTVKGILNRLHKYKWLQVGQMVKLEYFDNNSIYGDPYKVLEVS